MSEKKLSEELRHCLEDDDCGDCIYHEPDTKFICRGLLQKAYERIKEYEELEEQGKLLELPCGVGDTVYAFHMAKVIEFKVIKNSWFTMDRENIINVECLNTDCDCFRNFIKEEFGKTVFLTRPEAERALAEMEGKK